LKTPSTQRIEAILQHVPVSAQRRTESASGGSSLSIFVRPDLIIAYRSLELDHLERIEDSEALPWRDKP
jgi:hypothetical protein